MKRAALGLMGLVLLTALGGCGVKQLLERADQAMQTGRAAEAVNLYQQALAKEKKLAEDPEFLAAVERAKTLAAYQSGETLARQGNWEAAVQRYADALHIDPNFQPARQALENAKREAANVRHRRAVEFADQGDLEQAAAELRRALELEPDHTGARAALDSVTQGRTRESLGRQDFEQGLAEAGQKRWGRAAEAFRRAIAADANHLPARAERHRAETAIAQARQAYNDGASWLEQRQLDAAIASLTRALETWPTYTEAASLLATARARRKEAEDLYAKASAYASQSEWDLAIQSAEAALRVFPSHAAAQNLAQDARQRAAAAHADAGRSLLAEGQFDEAERRFQAALGYVPNMMQARDGLGQVAFARGRAAEAQGLWGAATLWYTEAAERWPNQQYAERRDAAGAQVLGRIAFDVALEAEKTDTASALVASIVKERIGQTMAASVPKFVRTVSGSTDRTAFTAAVRLTGIDIRMRPLRTERRTHAYVVAREVPNPEVPRLRHLLGAEQAKLMRMRQAYQRPCAVCAGTGRLNCKACRGTGVQQCPACRGAGRVPCAQCGGAGQIGGVPCAACAGSGKTGCTKCGGAGTVNCPACNRQGQTPCPRCQGTGRAGNVLPRDIQRQELRVRQLEMELRRQSPILIQQVPAEWAFTLEIHEKTGAMAAEVNVKRAGDGRLVRSEPVQAQVRYEDALLLAPNPEIGLPPDPLILPTDEQVQQALIDALAADAAGKILATVLGDIEADIRAARDRFQRDGKVAEAVEAGMDLVSFLRGRNDAEADRVVQDLRAQLRR